MGGAGSGITRSNRRRCLTTGCGISRGRECQPPRLLVHTLAPDEFGQFDGVVCNFALLDADCGALLGALRSTLGAAGVLLIQSVHPWTARGEAPYRDGWRTETYAGFGEDFTHPMPWFYRTLESWVESLGAAGWYLAEILEPLHPVTGHPASLLLTASPIRA